MTSVVVDLDALADSRWRDDLRDASNWNKYHAQSSKDPLDVHAFMLVDGLSRMGCDIGVISTVPARWAPMLRSWLVSHGIKADRLSCRATGNTDPNANVLATLIAAEPRPDFVLLGGDERVVEAVRATGVFIVQVHRP